MIMIRSKGKACVAHVLPWLVHWLNTGRIWWRVYQGKACVATLSHAECSVWHLNFIFIVAFGTINMTQTKLLGYCYCLYCMIDGNNNVNLCRLCLLCRVHFALYWHNCCVYQCTMLHNVAYQYFNITICLTVLCFKSLSVVALESLLHKVVLYTFPARF